MKKWIVPPNVRVIRDYEPSETQEQEFLDFNAECFKDLADALRESGDTKNARVAKSIAKNLVNGVQHNEELG